MSVNISVKLVADILAMPMIPAHNAQSAMTTRIQKRSPSAPPMIGVKIPMRKGAVNSNVNWVWFKFRSSKR
jgi:hypothetical protein